MKTTEQTPVKKSPWRHVVEVLLVATVYVAAAQVGMRFSSFHQNVTLIWPPSGIALAVVLIFGYRMLPGISLGAFVANLWIGSHWSFAIATAVGNPLEAFLGAWLLRRFIGFHDSLDRVRDVLGLAFLAAAVVPIVSATLGVVGLTISAFVPWPSATRVWFEWWLGDATGMLILSPFLLVWSSADRIRWTAARVAEGLAIVTALTSVVYLLFREPGVGSTPNLPLQHVCLALLVLSAYRFGQKGATLGSLITCVVAVMGTVRGHGPFAVGSTFVNLSLLLSFIIACGLTTMLLAAVLAERTNTEKLLATDEDRFRLLFEQSLTGVFFSALAGGDVECNPAFVRMFGYDSKEDLLRHARSDLYPSPADREAYLARLHREGQINNLEITLRRKDGTLFEAIENVTLHRDANGRETIHGTILDVTDRRRAEQSLREQETLLRAMFNGTDDAICIKDPEGRYVLVNEEVTRIVGRSQESMMGLTDFDLFPREIAESIRAHDLHVIQTGKPVHLEQELTTTDGSKRTHSIKKYPQLDAAGRVISVMSIGRDITARLRSEESLRANEKRYRQLFERDLMGAYCSVLREDGEVVELDCNPALVRMFGYDSKEDLLAHPVDDYYPSPADRKRHLEIVRRHGQVTNLEFTVRRKDGTLFEVIENATLFRDELGRETIRGTILDTTDRKRVQEELAAQERLLRDIIDGTDQEICLKDLDGRYLLVNETEARSFGQSVKEVVGLTDAQIFPPQDAEEIRRRDIQVMESGAPIVYEQEYPVRDGTRRLYSVRKFPRFDASKRVTGVIGIARDITDLKRKSDIINRIQQGTSEHVGEAFLAGMTRNLAEALGMTIALVGELCGDAKDRVRTMSVFSDTAPHRDFEYALTDTPCEKVVSESTCCYAAGVQERFPRDSWLKKMQIESYAGAPLVASSGVVLGVIVVMGRRPIEDPTQAEAVLNIFAGRATAELQRIRADRELREQQSLLRSIIDGTDDEICVKDREGRYLLCNQADAREFQRTIEFVLGKTDADLFPPEVAARCRTYDQQVIASGKPVEYEQAFPIYDGSQRVYSIRKYPRLDSNGDVSGVMTIGRNVTAQRRFEEALRESESRLRAIWDAEPECVKLVARDGTLLNMNAAGLRMVEALSCEQVVGGNILRLVAPEHANAFRQHIDDVFQGNDRELAFEIIGLQGTRRWMETHAVPLRNADGTVTAMLAITRDVTGRRNADENIRQRERELAHFARVSVMGEMASGLAHELNQPLTAVVNYCKGARIRLGKRQIEDPDLIAAIEDASREAHRAAEIIRGLARFVQKRESHHTQIRVNPTIQEVIVLASAEAKLARTRIELDLALENPS